MRWNTKRKNYESDTEMIEDSIGSVVLYLFQFNRSKVKVVKNT